MLGWVVLVAASVLMYRMAEMSDKSGTLWGGVTFVVCLICALIIPLPFVNLLIGLVLSFAILAGLSMVRS